MIIVGYDGSEPAREAVRLACDIGGTDETIRVMHVFDVPWQVDAYPWFEDFRDACRDVGQEVVDSAREVAQDFKGTVEYEVAEGKPAEVLALRARETSARLVVVGTRGLGPVRAAVGSVTLRLLHQAPCPVVVVPPVEAPG